MDLAITRITPQSQPELISRLFDLARDTFVEAFGANYTEADLNHYLSEKMSPEALALELGNPEHHFYAVQEARSENEAPELLGYTKFILPCRRYIPEDEPFPHRHPMLLERVYFRREFHGLGVADIAMRHALICARRLQSDFIYLSVWEHNPRAQRFYRRPGFNPFGECAFKVGNASDRELLFGRAT